MKFIFFNNKIRKIVFDNDLSYTDNWHNLATVIRRFKHKTGNELFVTQDKKGDLWLHKSCFETIAHDINDELLNLRLYALDSNEQHLIEYCKPG